MESTHVSLILIELLHFWLSMAICDHLKMPVSIIVIEYILYKM